MSISSQLLLSGSHLKSHPGSAIWPQVVGPDVALHSALDEADDSLGRSNKTLLEVIVVYKFHWGKNAASKVLVLCYFKC